MSHETKDLLQKAVLLEASGVDRNGEPTVDAATEIDVRWIDGQTEALNKDGVVIGYDATVLTSQEIALESIMWLGTEENWDALSSYSDVYQVKMRKDTPDVKGRNHRYRYLLMRFRDTLPTIN